MESGLPIRESRWHKPTVYWTIPALFLLVSVVIFISYNSYQEYTNPFPNYGMAALRFPALVLVFRIFLIPSVIGAILLLHKRKSAIVPSLFVLTLWIVAHLILTFGSVPFRITLYPTIFGASYFGLDVIMIVFLIKGWKKMFWKSKSHLSQNDSEK